jgi:SAM-dependent MidA family methyltransferase
MDRCLYDPDTGFYSSGRGRAGGRQGDFLTSPEVGPLFGAVLGRAIDTWWTEAGEPASFPVIDLGSGPGGLLRALELAAPPCSSAWVLTGIDRAHNDPVDVDLSGAVVIANELLDNVPFDIGMRTADGDQRLVIDGQPPAYSTGWERLGNPVAVDVPAEQPFPILAAASRLIDDLLVQSPMRIVAFDYGRSSTAELAERGGWLRTYRQHQRGEDPFLDPGAWDITTDIAPDQLPRPDHMGTQAEFLTAHGIEALVEEGRSYWKMHAAAPDLAAMRMRSRVREAEALLDLDGLGSFLCLEWHGNSTAR